MEHFDKAMSFAVGQVIIGILSTNWIAAAQGARDVALQMEPSYKRIVQRVSKRTIASLNEWRMAEHVPDDDLMKGIEIAEQAVSKLSVEQYADLARQFGFDPNRMAKAMMGSRSHDLVGASSRVAIQIISMSLGQLVKLPKFQDRLDRAINWATYREVEKLVDELKEEKGNKEKQDTARKRQFRDSLQTHSRTRLAALQLGHNSRKLYGDTGEKLGILMSEPEHWRIMTDRDLTSLAHEISMIHSGSELPHSINRIHLRGTYDTAHLSLVNAATLFQPKKDLEKLDSDAKEILSQIRQEINRPRYRTAIFITGRWGAGKSRLITEIAASILSNKHDFVLLRPSVADGMYLDKAILDEVQTASGQHYRSLSEFVIDLQATDTTAVVLVDNVDQFFQTREALDRTTQIMLDVTKNDRIRWVFSIDSWHLDLVLSPESTPRWDRMSTYGRTTQTVANWIDLDHPHEPETSIGKNIVERELGHRPVLSPSMEDLLKIPLNAWLFVETQQTAATSEFDKEFWEEVLNSLTWGKAERRACAVVSDALTSLFAESLGRPVSLADVLGRTVGVSSNEVAEALDVLGDAHLLDWRVDGTISLKSAPLWAGRIARSRLSSRDLSVNNEPRELFRFAMGFETDIAEPLIMHILIEVSGRKEFMNRCIKLFLDGRDVPWAGIWAAAINDLNVQETIVRLFKQGSSMDSAAQASPHDVYMLLRLWSSIKHDLPFIAFLKQLRPCYETIGGNGLQLLLEDVIDDLSGADVRSAKSRRQLLLTADGIERALSAPTFAERWTELCLDIVDTYVLLTEVDNFLRSDAIRTDERMELADRDGPWRLATAPFGLHLVDAVTKQVARKVGAKYAYTLFESKGWLDEDDPPYGTDYEVRSACHVALGHSYMRDSEDIRDLLTSLVRGTRIEQTSAIFILRHTGRTFGRHGVYIPEELWCFIDQLNSSRRLDRAAKLRWLKPMIKMTLVEVDDQDQVGETDDQDESQL